MTNNWLTQCLIRKVEELSEHIGLTGINGEKRSLKGYPEAIPQMTLAPGWGETESGSLGDADPEDALMPYFIVKTTEISYQEEGAEAKLYLLFCICDQSERMEGYQTLWNLLNRITGHFRANAVLDAFYCEKAMKAVVQEEDTYPYFFGGIEMTWNLPDLEEEEV